MQALVVQPLALDAEAKGEAAAGGASSLIVADVPQPALAAGECRVAVRLSGICGTDLELCRGYAGFSGIPGHEFVGTVIAGDAALLGKRVVGEINVGCGTCALCANQLERHCAQRSALGIRGRPGAFAETLSLPARNLLPVADSLADEQAVFCEPLAAALAPFEQVHIAPGTQVLVIGDGKLGLLVSQVCAHLGMRTTLRGRHARKLALAKRWGVTTEQTDRALDAVAAIEDAKSVGQQFPVVVECSGTPRGLQQGLAMTAPRGVLLLKSTYAQTVPPQIDWSRLVVDEIRVVGSRCGRLGPALQLLQSGRFDVRSLIDDCLPLNQGVAAFARASERGALKVLLRPAGLSAGKL